MLLNVNGRMFSAIPCDSPCVTWSGPTVNGELHSVTYGAIPLDGRLVTINDDGVLFQHGEQWFKTTDTEAIELVTALLLK